MDKIWRRNVLIVAKLLVFTTLTSSHYVKPLPFGASAYYPMDASIDGNEVSGSSVLEGENQHAQAIFANGVSMSGVQNSGLTAKPSDIPDMNNCLTLANNCVNGFTISFFVKFGPKDSYAPNVFFIQSADNFDNGPGFYIRYRFPDTELRIRMTSTTRRWEIIKMQPFVRNQWIWYVVTWHPLSGLRLYKDGVMHGSAPTSIVSPAGIVPMGTLYIGRSAGGDPFRLEAIYDELIMWNSVQTLTFLRSVEKTISNIWGTKDNGQDETLVTLNFRSIKDKKLPEGSWDMKLGVTRMRCLSACQFESACFSVSWGTPGTEGDSICRLSNIINLYNGTIDDTNYKTYFKN